MTALKSGHSLLLTIPLPLYRLSEGIPETILGLVSILSGWPPWPGPDYSAISPEKPLAILDDLRGRRNPRVIGAFFFEAGLGQGSGTLEAGSMDT